MDHSVVGKLQWQIEYSQSAEAALCGCGQQGGDELSCWVDGLVPLAKNDEVFCLSASCGIPDMMSYLGR